MTYPIPRAALEQHIAILGKTGAGKTNTSKLIVEQIVGAGFRVCVLDPIKSDWWGITSSADGTKPGLPFSILGGPRAHVPMYSGAGKAIGELVASGKLPLSVLDMADFRPGGLAEFFCDFADTLHRKMRGVLYLVIEEAHEFAPKERAGIGNENMSIHYAKKLATAGRSKGIRLIVATQRTQSLHNAVLGSCETMIVHRLTAPADQLPVKKWLAANAPKDRKADVERSLSRLKTGTGWVCSGELGLFELTQFPRISTFDNSATPKRDSKPVNVKTVDVDLDALRALVGEAVKDAEADDPKALKKRIAELEKELKGADKVAAAAARQDAGAVYQVASLNATIGKLKEALEHRDGMIRELRAAIGGIKTTFESAIAELDDADERSRLAPKPALPVEPSKPPTFTLKGRPEKPVEPVRYTPTPNGKLPKAETMILRAFYWLRNEDVTPEKVAFYSGYSKKSSSTANALGALRSAGLVAGWGITNEGAALIAAGAGEKPMGPELREWLRPRLEKSDNALLDALAAARGKRLSNAELAARAGYSLTSSSFANAIGKLRTLGAAEGHEKDGGPKIADVFL